MKASLKFLVLKKYVFLHFEEKASLEVHAKAPLNLRNMEN